MAYSQIQEPVEVIARFSPQGMIQPLAFDWGGQRHRVQKVTYRWRTGKGRATLRFFAVMTDAKDACQLCYRDEDATWWLERVWIPG
jgi:hypothetical protein